MFVPHAADPDSPERRTPACGRIATAVLACAALLASLGAADERSDTQISMHRVFDALSALVPVAFASSGDAWKTQAKQVEDSMSVLAAETELIAAHGREQDASFRVLSESLASEVRTLRWQVRRGDTESASFYTQRLLETCVACHVRLPSAGTGDFARSLMRRIDPTTLSPLMQATLETAGRQFDKALATYEKEFASPDAPLDSFEYADAMTSYLIVALRVQRDPARVSRTLQALGGRDNLSGNLKLTLGIWQRALKDLGPALREPPTLERAEQILEKGRAVTEFPVEAGDDMHTVLASSVAFRYLEEKRPEGQDLARALYLLARTEAFTRRSFEMSESSSYLEQAIYAAPRTAIAERAYSRLEQQTILQYNTPFGIQLPDDVDAWLTRLRELSGSKGKRWYGKPPDNTAALPGRGDRA